MHPRSSRAGGGSENEELTLSSPHLHQKPRFINEPLESISRPPAIDHIHRESPFRSGVQLPTPISLVILKWKETQNPMGCMGYYRRKLREENDSEVLSMPNFSKLEDRAFFRGRRYERRRLFRIVWWCAGGLIFAIAVVRFLDGYVIFIPIR